MADPHLPKEVRDLVRRRLRNMEEIEVLLMLASSSRPLTVEEICAGLRIPASTLPMASVDRLLASELIRAEAAGSVMRYRFEPATPALRESVALLAIAYNEKPVSLVRLVYHRDEPAPTFDEDFPAGPIR